METPMNFDPMTGQPLTEDAMKMNEAPKKNNGAIVGIIVGVVALIIAVIGIVIYVILDNGLLKVSNAISTMVKDYSDKNLLINTLDISDMVEDKEYTVDMVVETEVPMIGDISVSATSSVIDETINVNGNVDLSYIPAIEYKMQLTDSQLKAKIPLLDDYIFTYDYTIDNNGYLMDEVDATELNVYLQQLYGALFNSGLKNEEKAEAVKQLQDEIKKLKFSKVKSAEYTVDEKPVKCKGYKVSLTKEDIDSVLNKVNGLIDDSYKNSLSMSGIDTDSLNADELGLDNLDIIFYLYKKELSAIAITANGSDTETICFLGGDYRAQNISLIENNTEICRLNGSIIDGIETFEVIGEGQNIFDYKYDTVNNNLSVGIYDGDDYYDVNLSIEKDAASLDIGLDYLDIDDTYIGGSLKITDGASYEELSGSEFNVGTASEDEVNELLESIYSIVLGLLGW